MASWFVTLTRQDGPLALRRIWVFRAKRCKTASSSRGGTRFVHGRATLRDRLAPALADVAPHVSCDQLIRYWFEGDAHLDEALLLQLAEVRASGVPLHLATVQEHERASYLWDTLKLRDRFDDIHYAAQLGVSKPSQDFYAAVEQRVGLPASAIAFIDDTEKNVEAARARGWNAALWTPGATLNTLIPELSD